MGLLFIAIGALMLYDLLQLPERLDAVLVLNTAIAQLIRDIRSL